MAENKQVELEPSESQRRFLFENLKDVLDERILGGKRIKDVFGVTTQSILRESVHTYCLHKKIIAHETFLWQKGVPEEERTDKNKIPAYRFVLNVRVPGLGDKLEIERIISKKRYEDK